MAIYKRGGVYWFSFIFDSRRIQKSTKQGDRQAATDIEAAYRTALAKGEVGITERKPIPTLAEFAPQFTAHVRTVNAAKIKTVKHYTFGMRKVLEYPGLRNARLDEIDTRLISQFAAWRETQPILSRAKKRKARKPARLPKVATVNRQIEVLRRALHLAAEWKIIPAAPRIKRLKGEVPRDRVVSHEEEKLYLAAATPTLRAIATILVDTGLRPEELYRAQWQNVFLQPAAGARFGRIFVPNGKTPQARRHVPLTARAKTFLELCGPQKEGFLFPAPTQSGHVEISTLRRAHAAALKESGVKPFVLYSFRHTALTRLGEAGADAFAIQKIAGHASILISQRYVHPSPERIESAIAALDVYNIAKQKALETPVTGLVQ